MALTPKQQAFVREYLIDLDASKAVARAGYHATGQRAAEMGYQLLQKTPVKTAIKAAMDERAQRVNLDADSVPADVAAGLRPHADRCPQDRFVGRHHDRWQVGR